MKARSSTAREHDDEAVRLRALAGRLDARIVLQPLVDDLPLDGGHGLEGDALAAPRGAVGASGRKIVQHDAAALPVAGGVDDHVLLEVREAAADDRVGEVLDRVDRLAMPADQDAELTGGARRGDRLLLLLDLDAAADAERTADAVEHRPDPCSRLGLVA